MKMGRLRMSTIGTGDEDISARGGQERCGGTRDGLSELQCSDGAPDAQEKKKARVSPGLRVRGAGPFGPARIH